MKGSTSLHPDVGSLMETLKRHYVPPSNPLLEVLRNITHEDVLILA